MKQSTQADLDLGFPQPAPENLTAGQWLIRAREAKGMSAQDMAARTNRSLAQIMALEADDYERVGQGVLLRAIVRHCAKVVGADQEEAIRHLPLNYQTAQPTLPEAIIAEHPTRGVPLKPVWISRIWLALLALVIFGLLGYWTLVSRFLQTSEVSKRVTESNQVKVITPLPEVSPPAVLPPASVEATQAPNSPVDDATAALNAPTVAPEVAANSGDTLMLKFKGDSWVEIKDADDKVLLSGSQIGNTEQSVSGKTPLKVKIGSASQVEATWKGAPYDLTPVTKGDVARIEELD